MADTPDPDALDALIASTGPNSWYGRGCRIGRIITELDPGPYRDRLVGYMARTGEITHRQIASAMNATLNPTPPMSPDMVGQHRRLACSCPSEVRT